MNQPVSHPCHFFPFNVIPFYFEISRYLLGSFTNYFQTSDNSPLKVSSFRNSSLVMPLLVTERMYKLSSRICFRYSTGSLDIYHFVKYPGTNIWAQSIYCNNFNFLIFKEIFKYVANSHVVIIVFHLRFKINKDINITLIRLLIPGI